MAPAKKTSQKDSDILSQKLQIEQIIEEIALRYKISKAELINSTNDFAVFARTLALFFARETTRLTDIQIGQCFASTEDGIQADVSSAHTKVKAQIKKNPSFAQAMTSMKDAIAVAVSAKEKLAAKFRGTDVIQRPLSTKKKIAILAEVVSTHFDISFEHIKSTSRNSDVLLPRQVMMYLMKVELGIKVSYIGGLISEEHTWNHGTVVHAVKKITEDNKNDTDFAEKIETLKKQVRAALIREQKRSETQEDANGVGLDQIAAKLELPSPVEPEPLSSQPKVTIVYKETEELQPQKAVSIIAERIKLVGDTPISEFELAKQLPELMASPIGSMTFNTLLEQPAIKDLRLGPQILLAFLENKPVTPPNFQLDPRRNINFSSLASLFARLVGKPPAVLFAPLVDMEYEIVPPSQRALPAAKNG